MRRLLFCLLGLFVLGAQAAAEVPVEKLEWVGRLGNMAFQCQGSMTGLLVSRDGKHLYTSSGDKTLREWNAQTGKGGIHYFLPQSVGDKPNPTPAQLPSVSRLTNLKPSQTPCDRMPARMPNDMHLSPDETILSARFGREWIIQWKRKTGGLFRVLHCPEITCFYPLPDGKTALAAIHWSLPDPSGTITYRGRIPQKWYTACLLIDLEQGKILHRWNLDQKSKRNGVSQIYGITANRDGTRAWLGLEKEIVRLDLTTRKVAGTIRLPALAIKRGYTPDLFIKKLRLIDKERSLLVWQGNGGMFRLDATTGKEQWRDEGKRHSTIAQFRDVSPDGLRYLRWNGQFYLSTGKAVDSPAWPRRYGAKRYAPDGKTMFAANGGRIRQFDLQSGKMIPVPGPVASPIPSSSMGKIRILENGKLVLVNQGRRQEVLWDREKKVPLWFTSKEVSSGIAKWWILDVEMGGSRMVYSELRTPIAQQSVGKNIDRLILCNARTPEKPIRVYDSAGRGFSGALLGPKEMGRFKRSGNTAWFTLPTGSLTEKSKRTPALKIPFRDVSTEQPSPMKTWQPYMEDLVASPDRSLVAVLRWKPDRKSPGRWLLPVVELVSFPDYRPMGYFAPPSGDREIIYRKIIGPLWQPKHIWFRYTVGPPEVDRRKLIPRPVPGEETMVSLYTPPGANSPVLSAAKIKKLIRQLGSRRYAERQEADQKLRTIQPNQLEVLRKYETSDAEIRVRLRAVIRELSSGRLALQTSMELPNRHAIFLAHPNGKHWVVLSGYRGQLGRLDNKKMTPLSDFTLPAHAVSAAFTPDGELLIGTSAMTVEMYHVRGSEKMLPRTDNKK